MTEIRIAFFDIDGTLVQLGKGMSETMRQTLLALQKKGIRICVATGRPPFRVPSFDGIVFDIIPKGSGMDAGVKQILSYFGFRKEEAMAFGDGGNDIGMLESVGTGVAMGNAAEDVKAAVPYVCAPVEEEGIYQFCRERHILWK